MTNTTEEPNCWPEGHFTSVLPLRTQHRYLVKCKCGWTDIAHTNAVAWQRSAAHRLEMSK